MLARDRRTARPAQSRGRVEKASRAGLGVELREAERVRRRTRGGKGLPTGWTSRRSSRRLAPTSRRPSRARSSAYDHAAPYSHCYLGLERYWRKRAGRLPVLDVARETIAQRLGADVADPISLFDGRAVQLGYD